MAEQAKIPPHLQPCKILKVHDDGDVTIESRGRKYVVTTEGKVFGEEVIPKCMLPKENFECMLDYIDDVIVGLPGKRPTREDILKAMRKCAKPVPEMEK